MTATFKNNFIQWSKSKVSLSFKKQQEIPSSYESCLILSCEKKVIPSLHTFRNFLKKNSRILAFRAFLQKEFSEENLDFWLEVELYKKKKLKKQLKMAQNIFDKYIAPNSPKELNLDSSVRRITAENLNNPDISTFDEAQERILMLMERDSFRRFLSQNSDNSEDWSSTLPSSISNKISNTVHKRTSPSSDADDFYFNKNHQYNYSLPQASKFASNHRRESFTTKERKRLFTM